MPENTPKLNIPKPLGNEYFNRTNFNDILDAIDDGAAAEVHTHGISDVTGLQNALDGKAPTSHTHSISDVTGLQTTLDGKAPTNHTHSMANVTGLVTALDGKAPTTHSHTISQVTNLQTTLNGKASTTDVGDKSLLSTTDKTNLVAAINETFQYANDGKTAVASAITAKGVSASPTDTFSQLATKIGQIKTGQLKKSLLLSDGSGVSKQFRYPNGSNAINQVYYTLLKSEIGFDPDVLIVSGTTVYPDHFVYQKEGFLENGGSYAHALATAPNYTSNSPNTYLLRKDEIDVGDRFHVPIMTSTGAKSYIAIKYTQ